MTLERPRSGLRYRSCFAAEYVNHSPPAASKLKALLTTPFSVNAGPDPEKTQRTPVRAVRALIARVPSRASAARTGVYRTSDPPWWVRGERCAVTKRSSATAAPLEWSICFRRRGSMTDRVFRSASYPSCHSTTRFEGSMPWRAQSLHRRRSSAGGRTSARLHTDQHRDPRPQSPRAAAPSGRRNERERLE